VNIDNAMLSVNRTPTNQLLADFGGEMHDEGVMTVANSIISQNDGRFGGVCSSALPVPAIRAEEFWKRWTLLRVDGA